MSDGVFTILGVDPGVQRSGWAVVSEIDGFLLACGLTNTPYTVDPRVGAIVVEKPQVYRAGKGDPNDLINVAVVTGEWLGIFRDADQVTPLPRQWKGQVPKLAHNARTLGKLTSAENRNYLACVAHINVSARHNVIDAIGLAKWGYKNRQEILWNT